MPSVSLFICTLPRALQLTLAASPVGLAALAGCASNDTPDMPGMGHGSNSSTPAAASESAAAPSTATTPAAGPHNNADVMFAQMMIPHHQQAIEMSDMILTKDGIDPQVSDLAEQIKAAQAPEIAQMSGWLAGWGEDPSRSMASDHDMDALEQASGDQAARLFLTGMITHHQGAITMAEKELAQGQNPDAKQLAQDIIDAQQAEITNMKQLLDQL